MNIKKIIGIALIILGLGLVAIMLIISKLSNTNPKELKITVKEISSETETISFGVSDKSVEGTNNNTYEKTFIDSENNFKIDAKIMNTSISTEEFFESYSIETEQRNSYKRIKTSYAECNKDFSCKRLFFQKKELGEDENETTKSYEELVVFHKIKDNQVLFIVYSYDGEKYDDSFITKLLSKLNAEQVKTNTVGKEENGKINITLKFSNTDNTEYVVKYLLDKTKYTEKPSYDSSTTKARITTKDNEEIILSLFINEYNSPILGEMIDYYTANESLNYSNRKVTINDKEFDEIVLDNKKITAYEIDDKVSVVIEHKNNIDITELLKFNVDKKEV